VPPPLLTAVHRNVEARREFRAMHTKLSDTMPTWRIVDAAPPDALLADYKEAGAAFGISWQVLAAINLVETGMGRIRGTSSAGAQGPMQFMPATWASFGAGGDINNAHDAIMAAARYLAHNNAATDIVGALWNYNHSYHYVRGVLAYASNMQEDPQAFLGYYHWAVIYLTAWGDIWLQPGYEMLAKMPVADFLATHPQ
jgi:membrane-bound lytic murein transglycosylase B